jgi:hypothetical protein
MPIKMEFVYEKGWKETSNNRFGFVLVIRFIDTVTNNVLFRFAPTLKDLEDLQIFSANLLTVDRMHKDYINKLGSLPMMRFSSTITCLPKKEEEKQ